jgi:glutamate racemase
MTRVLVFDSGVGGLSVLDAIVASGASVALDYVADHAWMPYGLKSDTEIAARVPALLSALCAQWAPDAVVLACNTASTIALEAVRKALSTPNLSVPVIGVVPPIKPAAAATRTGAIGLLATPATVRRPYTEDLIERFASQVRVTRFGSSALVRAAEAKLRGEAIDPGAIEEAIEGLFGADPKIDAVALACTHFPLLRAELEAAGPHGCLWLDSGAAIARRLIDVVGLTAGAPARAERAGFTLSDQTRAALSAFKARGFSEFAELSEGPDFYVAPLRPL